MEDILKIHKKLRLRANMLLLVMNAPTTYLPVLEGQQFDTIPLEEKIGDYDFIQVFATRVKQLDELLKVVKTVGKYDCILWFCYPKGSSKIESDIKRDLFWPILEKINMRPVAQVQIGAPCAPAQPIWWENDPKMKLSRVKDTIDHTQNRINAGTPK